MEFPWKINNTALIIILFLLKHKIKEVYFFYLCEYLFQIPIHNKIHENILLFVISNTTALDPKNGNETYAIAILKMLNFF